MAEKEQGTVRWFNNKKGYGFVQKKSDAKDIFVHFSAIEMEGYRTLKTGDQVEFEITDGEKGPQASKVVIVGSSPTAEIEKAGYGTTEKKPPLVPLKPEK